MNRLSQASRPVLRRLFLPSATYRGSNGATWFAGIGPRAPSIAAFYCGDDVGAAKSGRIWRNSVPNRISSVAEAGGLPILRLPDSDSGLEDLLGHAVAVPTLVDIHTNLPADVNALRPQLLTSTTREDFRRIRRANFEYRVTNSPDAIREFHARHYVPLVEHQYPEDGRIASAAQLIRGLGSGGELVCADIDGVWVAGIFNFAEPTNYSLRNLGIRDADHAVRQKRVTAALIIRSLERAVELGRNRATLGRSLPFLGKGPVWFKAKWGGIITRHPNTPTMHMFLDLRNGAVRRMLSASPVIHIDGDALVASTWLEPGEKSLHAATRDAGRFPGIAKWYVLAEPSTLHAGEAELSASDRIVSVPITPEKERPIWLGDVLHGAAVGA